MIGLVVATHGDLAGALLTTAEMIVGAQVQTLAVNVSREVAPEEAHRQMAAALAATDTGTGTLIAADMFGGTPANVGMTFLSPGRVELLTGVNLPLLLKFFAYRQRLPLPELALFLRDTSREGIVLASEVLRR